MIWRVEIRQKGASVDAAGTAVLKDIVDLGIDVVKNVRVVSVYLLEGDLTRDEVKRLSEELLVDPVVEEYGFSQIFPVGAEAVSPKDRRGGHARPLHANHYIVEIAYNPGVMDPVEASTLKGIRDLGISSIQAVRTAKQYHLRGNLSDAQVEHITGRLLMNKLIQHVVKTWPPAVPLTLKLGTNPESKFDVVVVNLLEASRRELIKISKKGQLYLNLVEMKAIQAYFKKQGRNPTDVELETVAQTWSEHCHHKTFRGIIRYRQGKRGKPKIIRSLFKTTIAKATLEVNKKWCVSVFHDNAGVVAFDKDYHVCFKVETHNHPCALEPFGGANTGVGGVIRDILGTGLGAKPLANTDVFCFAPPDTPPGKVPAGSLNPKRIMKGVVGGVRDYGNKMGIPTVNGAIVFDKHFVGNPLVFCGNVGLIPCGQETKKVNKGDLIVAIGGRTGRDGIHGATFSSGELTSSSETVSSGAVQIGNPIEEKKVLDALMKARDRHLYSAITDCGAGGFSSAVGEMGRQTGARVDLDKAPLKYEGLNYTEIWISESQERMVLAVPPAQAQELLKIFSDENVEAYILGEFDGSGRLQLFYHGHQVADLDMHFLHEGIPQITKQAIYEAPKLKKEKLSVGGNLTDDLCDALSHFNVASKESVIRVYDHEVQGTSVIKPLVGVHTDGPSDAAVLAPRQGSRQGIAISNGINVRFGMIDPFWMSASCIDEAIRQIIAVGGSLDRMALLDNFCWGNPDKPDRLGSLVRAAQGCYQAAKAFGTPFISGKDSLYNEYTYKGRSLAIPGTILISALGVIEDISKTMTMDLKKAGNRVYVVGTTFDELGGSIYLANHDQEGAHVPKVHFPHAVKLYQAMGKASRAGLLSSAHDISEGGLAVALAEMAFAGGLGVTAFVKAVPFQGKRRREDVVLFSESNSRLLVEVAPNHEKAFQQIFKGVVHAKVATVEDSPEMIIYGFRNQVIINANIVDLKNIWQKPLR